MGRKPTGDSARERARQLLKRAITADELRVAQAVLLPLELGLTIEGTAKLLGKTSSWVSRTRRRFISAEGAGFASPSTGRGGRRHATLSEDEEVEFVKRAVVRSNRIGGRGVHGELRVLLAEHGLSPHPSTVTAIMQRVTDKIMPGQKASCLGENVSMLAHLWSREVRLKEREK